MNKLRLTIILFMVSMLVQGTWPHQSIAQGGAENKVLLSSTDVMKNLQGKEMVALQDLLTALEQQFDVTFLYRNQVVENKMVPSDKINLEESTQAGRSLSMILQGLDLSFQRIDAQTYVLLNGQPSFRRAPVLEQVTGQVTDASTGETMPGVNVLVKGTTTGTSTDSEGRYELSVPSLQDTLVFSFIGYQRQEVPIDGRTEIDLELQSQAVSGDELVVIGYGTTRKEELTGSVSKVEGEALENVPNSRVDQILQGRAAGVQVTQVSGEPGSASSIRIRGGNSIQGNNEPLWVIDGVIVGQNFNLNNINSNDIESIDILKDATAVSIYGTRGANGVILVTTKSGSGLSAGSPEISISAYSGIQSMTETVDFLNGREHAEYANEDAEFRSAALPFSNIDNVPNVDWIDQVTRDASVHNVDLSVAGTSEDQKINYYLSANHFNQEGVVRESQIKKYIFRTNLDYQLSDAVQTGFRLNISRLEQKNNVVNIAQVFRDILPNRAIYNDEGLFSEENPVSASIQSNPEADIQLQDNHDFVTNILGNVFVEIEPITNLSIRSTFSPEINENKLNQFNPGALPENRVINAGGNARVSTSSSIGFINENTVSYNTDLGVDHSLDLLGGFTVQKLLVEDNLARAFEFSNDITGYNNLSFGSNPNRNVVGSDFNAFQLVSWLGRANYSYMDKYLLTVVGRVDGSSRFAPGNKYGFFPSAAVGWRLSQEPFIKDLDVFDLLKLRASYGISGSQAIESFRTLALLDNANTTFNGAEQAGVTLGRPANEDLKWETTEQLDIGLESAFYDSRLSVELDYYYKKTSDLLLNVQIPRQTGFVSRLQNLGQIENKGLEMMVNTVNISNEDLRWSSTLSISGNRNEVVDLGGVDFINVVDPSSTGQGGPSGRLIVGESAPVFVGVEYLGTWKSQEEIDASGQVGVDVGGPRFKDTNGDGQITEDDFEVLGSPQPDFIYGFQNSVSYKNWALDFSIQGTYGNEVFNSLTQTAFFGRAERTKYAETLDRWTPNNQDSDIPRAGTVASLAEIKSNSEQIEDATHLRLKNLKLSYNLPVEKWGLNSFKNLSVYFSGTNLFILSNFRLNDPETSMFGRSNVAFGFSQGEYPSARTLSLGIKATL
ncbi:SusC/RagA family TonB-linked outer membrane protein [Halalkalibaculum sp. DA384]|uniref:SusC/RagA family TonB-linked outer membrane protein n=1 Tax=Halalkalibaculum sp. DA384 TaxID=3373606 RepID=UPI003753FADD